MRRPVRKLRSLPKLLFPNLSAVYTQGFAAAADWERHAGGVSGTIADDGVNYRTEDGGTNSVLLTGTIVAEANSTFLVYRNILNLAPAFTRRPACFDFWAFIRWDDDYTNHGRMNGTDAIIITFAPHLTSNVNTWQISFDDTQLSRGWNHLFVDCGEGSDYGDLTKAGTPEEDWSDIISIRFRLSQTAAAGLKINFDAMRFYNSRPVGAVILDFPDNSPGHTRYSLPAMKRWGYRGSHKMGALSASLREARMMQRAGWSVGHQGDGTSLVHANSLTTKSDLDTAYDTIVDGGLKAQNARFYTYPSNLLDEQALECVNGVANPPDPTMLGGFGGSGTNGKIVLDGGTSRRYALPPNQYQQAQGYGALTSSDVIADIRTATKRALQDGNVVIFGMHDVKPAGPDANEILLSDFRQMLQYINACNLPVVLPAELYDLETNAVSIVRRVMR